MRPKSYLLIELYSILLTNLLFFFNFIIDGRLSFRAFMIFEVKSPSQNFWNQRRIVHSLLFQKNFLLLQLCVILLNRCKSRFHIKKENLKSMARTNINNVM